MKRTAIIFHGTGGHPEYCWYPWLAQRLEARGYAVELRHYPDLNVEPTATFLPTVLASHVLDEATVLVGHSGGAALLRALLEHIETRVAQAILVAGYATQPSNEEEPVLQDTYDWQQIKIARLRSLLHQLRSRPIRLRRRAGAAHVRQAGRYTDCPGRGPLRRRRRSAPHLRAAGQAID